MRTPALLLTLVLLLPTVVRAEEPAHLDLERRLFVLSKTYQAIPLYFAHWQDAEDVDLDAAYREALTAALKAKDRSAFDRVMDRFLARLHNGHTWFVDAWERDTRGAPLGFRVRPLGRRWVVDESSVPDLRPGDVVERVDDVPIERFYAERAQFFNASNARQARLKLSMRPWLWPERFTLTLADGRTVRIERQEGESGEAPAVESRWLAPERVGYLRVSTFGVPDAESEALAKLEEMHGAEALVVDVRGNGGGNTPVKLIAALMDRPWPWWEEETTASLGLYRFYGDYAAHHDTESMDAYAPFRHSTFRWPSEPNPPAEKPYTGRILILVDARCGSACEDFVMPFSWTKRAILVGETTAGSTGQPWFHDFGDGMKVFVGTKRAYLPDGSPFEGVGLAPDVEVVPTVEDLAAGRDPVLDRAAVLATTGG